MEKDSHRLTEEQDANEEEEIVINEGKQLHEITDAIAPLLAADAHHFSDCQCLPHPTAPVTAPAPAPLSVPLPTPAPTPIAGSTCLGPQRHQRPSALSVDCFFAHPARLPCSNCKVPPPFPRQHTPALPRQQFPFLILHLLPLCVLRVSLGRSFQMSFFSLLCFFSANYFRSRQRDNAHISLSPIGDYVSKIEV